jgi:hypothetical protein
MAIYFSNAGQEWRLLQDGGIFLKITKELNIV